MFRPQIQKTRILILLVIINLSMVYIAHLFTYKVDSSYRKEKEEAAAIMDDALKVLKAKIRPQYKSFNMEELIEELTDRDIEYKEYVDRICFYMDNKNERRIDHEILDKSSCQEKYREKYSSFGYHKPDLTNLLKEYDEDKLQVIYKAIDPNLTGLISIGNSSPIITGSGNLGAKQTALKTDFAALIVDEFINAGIVKGDTVAVGMTGSMPGANIAFLSACKALDIHPIIISSIGASEWGASDTNFLWIDMEHTLKQDSIFNNISIAYSPGGKGDCLRPKVDDKEDKNRKRQGLKIFEGKINSYNAQKVIYNVNDFNNLKLSVKRRLDLYGHFIDNIENYKAYVNIGGGAASIGIGGRDIFNTPGYLPFKTVKDSTDNNHYSVIREFADKNISTIHISHIKKFVKGNLRFGHPINQRTGEIADDLIDGNEIYEKLEYSLTAYIIALLVSLVSVVSIGIISHNQIKRRMHSYEPESIL